MSKNLCFSRVPEIIIAQTVSMLQHSILFYFEATAQAPISSFWTAASGLISKSKISIGRPRVVQALGICNGFVSKLASSKYEEAERKRDVYSHQQYQQYALAQAHNSTTNKSADQNTHTSSNTRYTSTQSADTQPWYPNNAVYPPNPPKTLQSKCDVQDQSLALRHRECRLEISDSSG